jgi:hypothetical protein
LVSGSLGLEHKALCGPFAQNFPSSTIWLQPGQWSFPINLPNYFLGFPFDNERLKELPIDGSLLPWSTDFDYAVLGEFVKGQYIY